MQPKPNRFWAFPRSPAELMQPTHPAMHSAYVLDSTSCMLHRMILERAGTQRQNGSRSRYTMQLPAEAWIPFQNNLHDFTRIGDLFGLVLRGESSELPHLVARAAVFVVQNAFE